jgi:hypothetical protein
VRVLWARNGIRAPRLTWPKDKFSPELCESVIVRSSLSAEGGSSRSAGFTATAFLGEIEGFRPSSKPSALRRSSTRSSPLTTKSPRSRSAWLGREDSNLRMAESKSAALPLGYAPTRREAGWARRKAGRRIVRALPHRNGCPGDCVARHGQTQFCANAARSALAPQTRTPTRSSDSGR